MIKAIVIIYAARILGTADYGVFSYALTLAGFFTLFIDPGLNGIVLRDASQGEQESKFRILSTTFYIKLVLVTAGIFTVLFIAPYFSVLPGAKALLPVVAFILFFDNLREFLFSFVRTMEKMEWEAGVFLLLNVAIVIFGFIALRFSPTSLALGWAYAAGTAIGLIGVLFLLRRYLKPMISHFSSRLVPKIFQAAWPFAVTGALGILLTNTDILIISWMRTASDVGVYSAAIRIIQTLYLIPVIIQFSTLPLFARLANKDNPRFRAALERIVGTIFLISVPLAIGSAVLGTQIMSFVFGSAYAGGGLAFKILMATMLVDFPAAVISNAIFAYNHQKSLIVTSAIGSISNVVFDIILIPFFGIAGSAVATLLAQAASNWYLWHMMKKINYFEIIPRLLKVVSAGILMGIGAFLLSEISIPVLLNIALCALFYFGLLYVIREPLLLEAKQIISPPVSAATPL
ncbi:MAG: flippase [Patescibacteria group bacterium]|nr:flippase [Patescibacteria group bacterium]